MFDRMRKKTRKRNPEKTDAINGEPQSSQLFPELDRSISIFSGLFTDVDIMLSRRFQNPYDKQEYCIFYSDGVVDSMMINEHIIKPLLLEQDWDRERGLFAHVRDQLVMMNDVRETNRIQDIVEAVTYGDTLLLIDGCDRALILSSKQFTLRSISEPESEKVLNGPREGFTESLMTNLSMIRRRLRTHELKLRFQTVGRQTKTAICICYMDNIVNKKILGELYRRLQSIDMDGILDSQYITEHISEYSFLGFSTCGHTERPDIVVSKLLEGRIAIVVDGTPMVLTVPHLFIENFQSNEDYYLHYYYASFSRMLRIVGFLLTIVTPALYVAIIAFHREILPEALQMSITTERASVPLSSAMEAFVMLLVFDILRETGVRMPSHVGQALSIVGALVIGQAAVDANLASSVMIIVVAFTGITNLLVPKIASAAMVGRYFCLLLASNFGLIGLIAGLSILLIHVLNLQTFGVPSLMPINKLGGQEVKDTFIRVPWPQMRKRTAPLTGNMTRSRPKNPDAKEGGLR